MRDLRNLVYNCSCLSFVSFSFFGFLLLATSQVPISAFLYFSPVSALSPDSLSVSSNFFSYAVRVLSRRPWGLQDIFQREKEGSFLLSRSQSVSQSVLPPCFQGWVAPSHQLRGRWAVVLVVSKVTPAPTLILSLSLSLSFSLSLSLSFYLSLSLSLRSGSVGRSGN